MSNHRELRKAEKKKGIKAQMSAKERAELNRLEVSKITSPDLSNMDKVPEYLEGSPKYARPRGYTFKRK